MFDDNIRASKIGDAVLLWHDGTVCCVLIKRGRPYVSLMMPVKRRRQRQHSLSVAGAYEYVKYRASVNGILRAARAWCDVCCDMA